MSYPVLEFERADDPDGKWMSMGLRMKLDLAGLRISLADWQALDEGDRMNLDDARAEEQVEVDFFAALLKRAMQRAGRSCETMATERAAAIVNWKDRCAEPPEVVRMNVGLQAVPPWGELDRFGRYVLYSLAARGRHEKFSSAARELVGHKRADG